MTTPTSMLPSPAMRNSRSRTSTSLASARFSPCGFRNGAMPSITKNSPRAANRSVRLIVMRVPRGASAMRSGGLWRAGILQVPEELPIRRDYQQIAILAEGAIVSLHAAVEGVELGILRVSARVGLGGRSVTLAADAQRVALGIRDDDRALPLRGGADAGTRLLPFRAQATRGLGKVLLHALVDARRHLFRQIDALHAHVDEIDPECCGLTARLTEHLPGDRRALARDDLLQGALRDDRLDAVLDDLREPLAGDLFAPAGRDVEERRILHLPLDIEVDDQAAAIVGEEGLARIGLRENAVVEFGHRVPGPLEVQPRRVVRADDGAELLNDGVLRGAHRKHRQPGENQQHGGGGVEREVARIHHRSPRPRASTVT